MALAPHQVAGGDDGTTVSKALQLDPTTYALIVDQEENTYSAQSGTVSTSGDHIILTPSVGDLIQLYYIALSAPGTNTASVNVEVRFSTGAADYKVGLVPGAIWARNIGAGKYYLRGAVGDNLLVNLSADQTVFVSVEYFELAPTTNFSNLTIGQMLALAYHWDMA